jgi:hypothetical protein
LLCFLSLSPSAVRRNTTCYGFFFFCFHRLSSLQTVRRRTPTP